MNQCRLIMIIKMNNRKGCRLFVDGEIIKVSNLFFNFTLQFVSCIYYTDLKIMRLNSI